MHWITEYRKKMQIGRLRFARAARCSERLIFMLEEGQGITHPIIANRIAEMCGATAEQRDSIAHGKHSGEWAPGIGRKAGKRKRRQEE